MHDQRKVRPLLSLLTWRITTLRSGDSSSVNAASPAALIQAYSVCPNHVPPPNHSDGEDANQRRRDIQINAKNSVDHIQNCCCR